MQSQGSFLLLENSSLVERQTLVLLFCNILASDPKTWYWTEFWCGVTWLNYIVVLSAVKRAETKLFFQRNLLLVMQVAKALLLLCSMYPHWNIISHLSNIKHYFLCSTPANIVKFKTKTFPEFVVRKKIWSALNHRSKCNKPTGYCSGPSLHYVLKILFLLDCLVTAVIKMHSPSKLLS